MEKEEKVKREKLWILRLVDKIEEIGRKKETIYLLVIHQSKAMVNTNNSQCLISL